MVHLVIVVMQGSTCLTLLVLNVLIIVHLVLLVVLVINVLVIISIMEVVVCLVEMLVRVVMISMDVVNVSMLMFMFKMGHVMPVRLHVALVLIQPSVALAVMVIICIIILARFVLCLA